MLKYRIITALILIPITILVLFYLPSLPFVLLISFITLASAWEWTTLMGLKALWSRFIYLIIMMLAFVGALFLRVEPLFMAAFIWWLIATLFIIFYPRGSRLWGQGYVIRGLMGLFVLVPCWAAVNFIRHSPDGNYRLLFLFVLIWGADSAAYFVGKKWGKTKLAPQVSPGKSIQGAIGAFIFTFFIALLALLLLNVPLAWWHWGLLISFVTVLFSIIGDLFESMLKRQAGVKDSGRLLPGHGGLLDRIDSLTAAAPIFTLVSLMVS